VASKAAAAYRPAANETRLQLASVGGGGGVIGEQAICSTGEAGGVWRRRRSSEMYKAAASAQLIAADEARKIRLKSIKL
jgi:hypothetical protein